MNESLEARKIFELARQLLNQPSEIVPEAYPEYESAVSAFVDANDSPVAVSLAIDMDKIGFQGGTDRALALYPILKAFDGKFVASSEILLELSIMGSAIGGPFLEEAPTILKKAFDVDNSNYYVLWHIWGQYITPDFPESLRLSENDLEHERICIGKILKIRPSDKLARTIEDWLVKHQRPYVRSRDVPVPIWSIVQDRRPFAEKSLGDLLTPLHNPRGTTTAE